MPESLEVHRLFLASPGDVMEERRAAHDVVAAFNDTATRRHKVLVYLTGWEQVTPDMGRPQSLINHLIDECDLFVGLVHHRWGTPTGDYSSGFEEEFHRARKRRSTEGRPDVGLFFKIPSPEMRETRDEQFAHVQAFRSRLQPHLMWGDVADVSEWKFGLLTWLNRHVPRDLATADTVMAESFPGVAAEGWDPESSEVRARLRDLMVRLPETDQTVLGLYYFEGLTPEQIGDILGLDLSDVEHRHEVAMLRLARWMHDMGGGG